MFLFINSYPPENSYKEMREHNSFYFFPFMGKIPKDGWSQFLANLLTIELFQKRFRSFFVYFQETPILMNTS